MTMTSLGRSRAAVSHPSWTTLLLAAALFIAPFHAPAASSAVAAEKAASSKAAASKAAEAPHVAEELTKRTYACAIAAHQEPGAEPRERVWCGTSFGLVPRPVTDEPMTKQAPDLAASPLSTEAVLLPDSVSALRIVDKQIFAAAGAGGLLVFAIDDPRQPRQVGAWRSASNVIGVDVDRAHVFVALGGGGWAILGRTRGGGLRELTRVDTAGYVRQVLPLGVAGDALVAVAEGSAGLSVWRFTDPRRPERVLWQKDTGGQVRHLALHEEEPLLAIANGRGGLLVARLALGAEPKIVILASGVTPDLTHGVCWAGSHLLAAAGSAGLLHSNARLDAIRVHDLEGSANKVFVHRGRAFVAVDHAGLVILPVHELTRAP